MFTTAFWGELIGSFTLIAFGCGINMNLSLKKTYGSTNVGPLAGALAWGMAVSMAVIVSSPFATGGHFNPAVTIGMAVAGTFAWGNVASYIIAQVIGSLIGAIAVWFHYKKHFDATEDPAPKLGVFATGPAIKSTVHNFYGEMFATFFLVFVCLCMLTPKLTSLDGQDLGLVSLGALGCLTVGFLIFAIGIAFGGTTGFALNPTRDLMPRIAHAILPIKGKGGSNWGYAWLPVVAPIVGGVIAGLLYTVLKDNIVTLWG